ncbi:hypothetical protein JMJ58_12375 [Haloterrigena salifodinae]|uniref:Uncharacterized protein n=1 Tax=Haloterrigena salifodinae TaxID=2675099 RepID=A0A8T8DW13_9EURY|nr:hypothetical protein [Haloterrigena salifodinae]QRV13749.1 hypothetical protein JMJ58_12375 [Haloterrigena salifodinae]
MDGRSASIPVPLPMPVPALGRLAALEQRRLRRPRRNGGPIGASDIERVSH